MPSAEELKAKGNAHFLKKEYKEAIKAYTNAIELDTSNAVLYSNRSAAHLKGNPKAALKDAEESLAIDESYTKGFLRKSKALHALGRPAHAEQALKNGLEKFPADPILIQALKDFYKEEEGDQSLLRGFLPGTPAQNMRDFQSAEGMKMGSPQMFYSLPNDAIRAAWVGQLDEFKRLFDPVKHSNLRSYKLKLPLTTLIVAGSQRLVREGHGNDAQFEEILKLVLEEGWCRVDAKDIAGYTALSHAAGHHPQLSLAKILIEYGADPNKRNRMGSTPLFSAVNAQEVEATKMILDAGGDPTIKDLDRCSVEKVALATSPRILNILHERMNVLQENRNLAPGGDCNNPTCGKPGATRRCGECRSAIYCNTVCQKQAWKQHKKVCGKSKNTTEGGASSGSGIGDKDGRLRIKIYSLQTDDYISRADFVRMIVNGGQMSNEELLSRSTNSSDPVSRTKAPKDASMVIKVQIPRFLMAGEKIELLLYNKSRSFQAHCDGGVGSGRVVYNLIKNKGIQQAKAYFLAYMEKEGELTLMIDKMLPAQPW
jgi:ankyrin repeat protein